MERFSRANRERFPKFLRNIITVSTKQFTIAVGINRVALSFAAARTAQTKDQALVP